MNNISKKLNNNRASMIRAEVKKAERCLSHISPKVNIFEILAKNENATDEDIYLLYIQIINQRNFYRLVAEHLGKAVDILENLRKNR